MLRGSYSQTFKFNVNCFDAATPESCMTPQFTNDFCRSEVTDMLNDAIIGGPFSILQRSS